MPPNLLPLKAAQRSFLLILALLLIASAGCGSPDNDSTNPSTEPPSPTETSIVTDQSSTTQPEITTSSTTAAVLTHNTISVTFDGSECSIDDSPEARAGDQTFVFSNESDLPVRMKVMVITEGNTYEDLLDVETENGGPGSNWAGPAWLPEALISFTAVDLELADNQSALRYVLEPGLHTGLVFTTTSPFVLWLCGPLAVAES